MKGPRAGDPFAALGLPARPGLDDDQVRSAWRRVAAATHPDREDGGDPARFAEAAAAYTALRTPFGRSEALADLAGRPAPTPARPAARAFARLAARASARFAARALAGPAARALARPRLRLSRLSWRVWHGRPARLAMRVLLTAAVSVGAAVIAGARPATPALITGAVTWLALTARHDLAP